MNLQVLERAIEARDTALSKLQAIQNAPDNSQISLLWSEFLSNFGKFIKRYIDATKNGPSKNLGDKMKYDNKRDDLLLYLHQARNADEHGIERITKESPRIIINATVGKKLHVGFLKTAGGNIIVDPATLSGATVRYDPLNVQLVPVMNFKKIYPVPLTHMGQVIPDAKVITLAELAIAYADHMLAEAKAVPLRKPA